MFTLPKLPVIGMIIACVGSCALLVPLAAHASKGSIVPGSLRTANFGARAYAADMQIVHDQPCALISQTGTSGRGTVLACGTRLQRRANPGAFAPKHRFLSAFDVVADSHLTFVGLSTPSATTTVYSPLVIRTDLNGNPVT